MEDGDHIAFPSHWKARHHPPRLTTLRTLRRQATTKLSFADWLARWSPSGETSRSEKSFDALWHCLGSGISWLITQTTVLQGPFLPLLYNSIKNSKFSRTTHTKRAGSEQYNVEKLKQLSRRFREDLGEPRYPIGDPRTAVVGTITYLDTHASSSSTS